MVSCELASLSVVFPCFNDIGTIGDLVSTAFQELGPVCKDLEVIVVDDCSTDGSRALLARLAKQYPRLQVFCHSRNSGYGATIHEGIRRASKDLIICVDSDGQFDVRDLSRMIPYLSNDVDGISGYRLQRHDPWYRRVLGRVFNQWMQIVFDIRVRDIDCGFKLFRRATLRKVLPTRSSVIVWVEILLRARLANCKFVDVPVSHHPRVCGKSEVFSLGNIFKVGLDLARLCPALVGLSIQGEKVPTCSKQGNPSKRHK